MFKFFANMLSESAGPGSPSLGRGAFGLIVATVSFHLCWQTIKTHPIEWIAIGGFVGAVGAVTYVSNKVVTAYTEVNKPQS